MLAGILYGVSAAERSEKIAFNAVALGNEAAEGRCHRLMLRSRCYEVYKSIPACAGAATHAAMVPPGFSTRAAAW